MPVQSEPGFIKKTSVFSVHVSFKSIKSHFSAQGRNQLLRLKGVSDDSHLIYCSHRAIWEIHLRNWQLLLSAAPYRAFSWQFYAFA